ncbi:ClpP/crotonase-like domain-containing protein [Tricladium varicosporioides]|nr:ClpP/crotonase-like domain-containing protein [Hymenoscyphus varicosporioides]
MVAQTLFELPIQASPSSGSTGTIACTLPAPGVYLLTFTAPPDNRLVTPFCNAFMLALDIIEFSHPPGVVITTSGVSKFYSNGLDLEHATSTPGFFANTLFALFKRLLTYPMPTVSLINGHAFAGGFMVAMYHDYRIFNPSRGFLCLNELDLGVPLRPAMSSIFRQKLTPQTYKLLVLEAKRFGGKEALEYGIVDGLGGAEEAMKLVAERKLVDKPKTGVYGVLKAEMFRETLGYLEGAAGDDERDAIQHENDSERRVAGQLRVEAWNKSKIKAKL